MTCSGWGERGEKTDQKEKSHLRLHVIQSSKGTARRERSRCRYRGLADAVETARRRTTLAEKKDLGGATIFPNGNSISGKTTHVVTHGGPTAAGLHALRTRTTAPKRDQQIQAQFRGAFRKKLNGGRKGKIPKTQRGPGQDPDQKEEKNVHGENLKYRDKPQHRGKRAPAKPKSKSQRRRMGKGPKDRERGTEA